jgi:hypothetical protein
VCRPRSRSRCVVCRVVRRESRSLCVTLSHWSRCAVSPARFVAVWLKTHPLRGLLIGVRRSQFFFLSIAAQQYSTMTESEFADISDMLGGFDGVSLDSIFGEADSDDGSQPLSSLSKSTSGALGTASSAGGKSKRTTGTGGSKKSKKRKTVVLPASRAILCGCVLGVMGSCLESVVSCVGSWGRAVSRSCRALVMVSCSCHESVVGSCLASVVSGMCSFESCCESVVM